MSERRRIMLALSFSGKNFPSALYTLQQWAAFAGKSKRFEVIVGVETFTHRVQPMLGAPNLRARDAMIAMSQYCSRLVCWDQYVNDIATDILDAREMKSRPFYEGFSYGGFVNRMLLLANEVSSSYVVRVDPGTQPPEGRTFDDLVSEHIRIIAGTDRVVSEGYAGRLAIRDQFVCDAEKHHALVYRYTGIEPTRQVTGGALFTSRVSGVPAIPFEKYTDSDATLVWASDDGIYQILPATHGSEKLSVTHIPRFDPEGMPKPTAVYYRGVAGTVYLSQLISGNEHGQAVGRVREFIETLRSEHLDPGKYKYAPGDGHKDWEAEFTFENVAPAEFLAKIRQGWERYMTLASEWDSISDALKGTLFPFIQVS